MASPPLNGSPSVTEAVGGRDSRRVPGRTTSAEVKREQYMCYVLYINNMKDPKLAQNNIVRMWNNYNKNTTLSHVYFYL